MRTCSSLPSAGLAPLGSLCDDGLLSATEAFARGGWSGVGAEGIAGFDRRFRVGAVTLVPRLDRAHAFVQEDQIKLGDCVAAITHPVGMHPLSGRVGGLTGADRIFPSSWRVARCRRTRT